MIDKYVCIKEVLLEVGGIDYYSYKNYFKRNNVYDFIKDSNNLFPYTHESLNEHLDFYHFDLEEMNNFFILLSELRELKINKILNE